MGSCLVSTLFSSREVYTESKINNHMVIIFRKPFDSGFKQERAKLATEKLVKGYSTEPIEEDSEEVFCGGLPSYVEKPFHTRSMEEDEDQEVLG